MKVKKIDFQILRELSNNSRIKSTILAEKLNVTDKTIRNRIALLKDNGIFRPSIIIDPTKFNYHIRMDMFIKCNRGRVENVLSLLQKKYYFNLLYIGMHWGEDDISIQCVFEDTKDVFIFRQEIKQIESADIVSMKMVPFVFKDTHDWIPTPKKFSVSEQEADEMSKKFKSIIDDYKTEKE